MLHMCRVPGTIPNPVDTLPPTISPSVFSNVNNSHAKLAINIRETQGRNLANISDHTLEHRLNSVAGLKIFRCRIDFKRGVVRCRRIGPFQNHLQRNASIRIGFRLTKNRRTRRWVECKNKVKNKRKRKNGIRDAEVLSDISNHPRNPVSWSELSFSPTPWSSRLILPRILPAEKKKKMTKLKEGMKWKENKTEKEN